MSEVIVHLVAPEFAGHFPIDFSFAAKIVEVFKFEKVALDT